ncbi:hypothetical protein D3C86_2000480 [compost metagenome]
MIDHFVQYHALTGLQPAIFTACNGFNHQLHVALEDAALIILIAQFQPGFGCRTFNFAVGLRHHFRQTALQLLTGEPRSTRPDHA